VLLIFFAEAQDQETKISSTRELPLYSAQRLYLTLLLYILSIFLFKFFNLYTLNSTQTMSERPRAIQAARREQQKLVAQVNKRDRWRLSHPLYISSHPPGRVICCDISPRRRVHGFTFCVNKSLSF
jgi:hypothetical protein